ERIFGPADGAWRTAREFPGDVKRRLLERRVVDAQRHEPDAFGLLARDRPAGQKVVLGFSQAAEKRPDDARDIARRNTEARVSIDDARRFSRDRDISQDADHEPGTDRDAI